MAWNDFGYLVGVLIVAYVIFGVGLGFVRWLKISKEKKHTVFFFIYAVFLIGAFLYYTIIDQDMQTSYRLDPLLLPLQLFVTAIFVLIFYYLYRWNKLAFYLILILPLAYILRDVYNATVLTSLLGSINTGIDVDSLLAESLNSLYYNMFFLGVVYGAKEKFMK